MTIADYGTLLTAQEQELCENIFGAMCSALMQPVRA